MTRRGFLSVMSGCVLIGLSVVPARAAERGVRFAPGTTSTALKGTLRGNADATYLLQTIEGQVLQTLLTTSNRSCYFNVSEPGLQDAAHIGSISGNEFGRSPTKAGTYRFQIYLMRNAARRNESCRYALSVELTGKPGGATSGVSDRQMRDGCRAKVAGMYGVRSSRVRMAAIGQDADGPAINGIVNKGAEGVKSFRCRYTPDRQLKDVMALTPDGE